MSSLVRTCAEPRPKTYLRIDCRRSRDSCRGKGKKQGREKRENISHEEAEECGEKGAMKEGAMKQEVHHREKGRKQGGDWEGKDKGENGSNEASFLHDEDDGSLRLHLQTKA